MTRGGWALRAAAGVGLLAGARSALRRPALQRADVRVGDSLRASGSARVDRMVSHTTDLGSAYAVVGVAAALAAAGRRRAAADVIGVGGLAWNLAQANKSWVRRQRPYEAEGVRRLVGPPAGSSFPSGHAAVGAAVMTVLSDQARGRGGRWLLRTLGAYVACSRVYVGVHYPTDVLGGAGLGLALASVWRGPLARAGRGLVGLTVGAAARLGPPALRPLVAPARGVRPPPADGRDEVGAA